MMRRKIITVCVNNNTISDWNQICDFKIKVTVSVIYRIEIKVSYLEKLYVHALKDDIKNVCIWVHAVWLCHFLDRSRKLKIEQTLLTKCEFISYVSFLLCWKINKTLSMGHTFKTTAMLQWGKKLLEFLICMSILSQLTCEWSSGKELGFPCVPWVHNWTCFPLLKINSYTLYSPFSVNNSDKL